MLVPLGGWKKEQSSLVANMDVSILLMHKRANTLGAWAGWYRTSFSSGKDEPLYCYHGLLLLVFCCSPRAGAAGPAACCHQSCHEVLQLEMPLDSPGVVPEVPVLPSARFLLPIQDGRGLSLGSVGAGVGSRALSFPVGHR